MSNVVIASSEQDASAVAAVEEHHSQLSGALALHVQTLVAAACRGDAVSAGAAKDDLVGWCQGELVPHALAEEKALYPAAHAQDAGRLLVDGMLAEHVVITGLVERIAHADDPVRAAAAATALQVMFESHLSKENEVILPLLTGTVGVSVAALLGGMHELLGAQGHQQEERAGAGHSCGCGEVDGPEHPELDARAIPHAIRHGVIFGALDAVGPGGGLALLAPHDPIPLLAQVEQRWPGKFDVDYLERGPEAWRLVFVRLEATS